MKPSIDLAEAKARILHGLTDCLQSRRERLDRAIERGDERAVEMNRRYLAAEEAKLIELAASNDWDFWNPSRRCIGREPCNLQSDRSLPLINRVLFVEAAVNYRRAEWNRTGDY